MVTLQMIQEAQESLKGIARKTPLENANRLGENIYIKSENLQLTGAFKIRGAYNKIRSLTPEEASHGVIACSAGNHAQGIALSATKLGIKSVICMPEGAPISKVEATKKYGAKVELVHGVYDDAYDRALQLRDEKGYTFIHPFDDENVIASKDLIAVAKKAGTFVGDEAKNIIDFRASYARISEKMDQRMIDGLNYLNATYKYDSDALVADNTKFTISNLDASDKLVALYTNIKADRKLDKDDVFGYYKLSSIGKASNQEIEIFQLFKDRTVETATVGWVGVGNMSYNVFVPYYPMLIDGMYKGYQVSTASAKFTTEKPDTFCTYGTSWAQDAEGNWQRVSGFKTYPSNWKDSYYFTFEGLGGYIANADKITGKPLKAEAKAYVADKLAALQQELYKDFVTTDQLAKADDARALATENGKTMAEKAHKLGAELVEYITKDEALQPSVFTDVKEGAYYVDAVNWAVDKKVTSGKTETTFAPNDSCTRAQAVTFLWRAAGSPEPTASEMTFTDVKADSYYYKAVLWAVENKITSGMSDTLFAPDATCSRSQIVTFLYRMQNSPESKAENPFTDVKADAYYANAVLWAVENGVTTGASATTFDPAGDCTRGQIVTFLYRCLSK
mgnify:CR=1 FL=1